MLVGSLALAGGIYFYKNYLLSELAGQQQALKDERNKFNEADILSLQEFNRRVSAAELLLDNHISPSKVFDTLELTTKERIQFTDFELEQRPSQDVTLTIQGGTEEFKTVALQALQFDDDALMKDAIFTDISTLSPTVSDLENPVATPKEVSKVSFKVAGNISASLLLYGGMGANVSNISTGNSGNSNDLNTTTDKGTSGGVNTGDAGGGGSVDNTE